MYITAAKVPVAMGAPKPKVPANLIAPPIEVELSGKNAEDIRNDYGTAQRLVEQYENLRRFVCRWLR